MIYTITVGEKDEKWVMDTTRCVGYFFNLKDAKHAVLFNQADIFEHCYNLAVVEEVREGLYSVGRREWWYEWSYEKNKCSYLGNSNWHNRCVCNWGIG